MSNTYSSTLITDKLAEGATTILQNRFAPLAAFSRTVETDPVKPLATVQVKLVTAGATPQTNATNFESGNSTVDAVPVTVAQVTQSFQVSNADLNNGLQLKDLLEVNTKAFANAVIDVAFTPITEAIFGTAALLSSPAVFGWGDLPALSAALQKADTKHLVLDGTFAARLTNQPGYFQPVEAGESGLQVFGWDGIYQCSRWNGAGTNVRGFACAPTALAIALGEPVDARASILARRTIKIPGLQIPVAFFSWFNTATRTLWASLDVMIGSKQADVTALKIIKTT